MGGINFNLEDDNEILKINSPVTSVGGPYRVVYKNITERWAIVALNWDEKPRLGIRWFWGGGGNPFQALIELVSCSTIVNKLNIEWSTIKIYFPKEVRRILDWRY